MSAISHRKDIMKKATKNSLYYSMGFMSQNIIWYMINTYLMLFYTDVVSLSAGAISTIKMCIRDRDPGDRFKIWASKKSTWVTLILSSPVSNWIP